MRPTTRMRTLGLCACAVTLAGVLAACDSGKNSGEDAAAAKPATSAPPTAASSTASADPDAREKSAALTTYRRMWEEQMKAYRKASERGTQLTRYASLDALGIFRLDLIHMKKAGTVVTGDLGHEPAVTRMDLTAKQPTATVTDCLDLSRWETKHVKTGAVVPLPTQQPRRYQATATLQRWDGRWMVTAYTPHGDRSC
ncbi:hypothetical protein [Streptomyces sp. NPDC057403]|uniref:hypothetical protein n=1 Tax=Streptomyces sp. NPDC057403 TaxID=3346119 RepID=UPI00368FBA84